MVGWPLYLFIKSVRATKKYILVEVDSIGIDPKYTKLLLRIQTLFLITKVSGFNDVFLHLRECNRFHGEEVNCAII